jgi:hypothetical protein
MSEWVTLSRPFTMLDRKIFGTGACCFDFFRKIKTTGARSRSYFAAEGGEIVFIQPCGSN